VAAQRLKDFTAGARRYLRRGALVVPFIVGPFVVRLALGPMSQALAGALLAVAPDAPPPAVVQPAPADEPGDPSHHPEARGDELGGEGRRRLARRSAAAHAHVPLAPGADAGVAPAPSVAVDAASRGTIVVAASAVAKALEKKDVGARNAKAADGKPLGVRVHGVSRYHSGLQDGDVVISVSGVRTETTDAMVDAAMKALASGATKLTGRILRGDAVWDVVLELPPRS
jgi:hypothetical protein